MRLYAITNRLILHHPNSLPDQTKTWASGGVDYIQLREKDLSPTHLQQLAEQIKASIAGTSSRLLINLPTPDSPLAGLADGVHLSGPPHPKTISALRRNHPGALISVPCHSLQEVRTAAAEGVDLLLFSPVFEKGSAAPQGLQALHRAVVAAGQSAVFALGGVTIANAPACVSAGAAGVAGIRLFAGEDWRRLHDI